jgi:hypothetical protein
VSSCSLAVCGGDESSSSARSSSELHFVRVVESLMSGKDEDKESFINILRKFEDLKEGKLVKELKFKEMRDCEGTLKKRENTFNLKFVPTCKKDQKISRFLKDEVNILRSVFRRILTRMSNFLTK